MVVPRSRGVAAAGSRVAVAVGSRVAADWAVAVGSRVAADWAGPKCRCQSQVVVVVPRSLGVAAGGRRMAAGMAADSTVAVGSQVAADSAVAVGSRVAADSAVAVGSRVAADWMVAAAFAAVSAAEAGALGGGPTAAVVADAAEACAAAATLLISTPATRLVSIQPSLSGMTEMTGSSSLFSILYYY